MTLGVVYDGPDGTDSASTSARRGVTLGIEEAARTARLFGWSVVTLEAPTSLSSAEAVRFLTDKGVEAIVGNLTGSLQTRPRFKVSPLLLDIGSPPHRPAKECANAEFYLLPEHDSAQSSAGGARSPAPPYAKLTAWSPSLERFGAAQLNERYQKRFGTPMTEQAWAGWMSVKIFVDAVLKKGTTDPCVIERYLLTDARFDGHKGVPLFFDPRTHELVQPLFEARPSGEPEAVGSRALSGEPDQTRGSDAPCGAGCA